MTSEQKENVPLDMFLHTPGSSKIPLHIPPLKETKPSHLSKLQTC